MPLGTASDPSSASPREAGGSTGRREHDRLLRSMHIFAAVVREVMEVKALERASSLPLTRHQILLLKLLAHDGRHRIGEVAAYLGVSPAAATKNIDKLEELGLVLRASARRDRRAKVLTVSTAGRELVAACEKQEAERLEPVLAAFEGEELAALGRQIERLALTLLRDEWAAPHCLRCSGYFIERCPVMVLGHGCPFGDHPRGRYPPPASSRRTTPAASTSEAAEKSFP